MKHGKLMYVNFFNAGILSPMGNARFGCYIWFTFTAKLSWNNCRASILLPDSATSSRWWKKHIGNSKMCVSLFILLVMFDSLFPTHNKYIKYKEKHFLSCLILSRQYHEYGEPFKFK